MAEQALNIEFDESDVEEQQEVEQDGAEASQAESEQEAEGEGDEQPEGGEEGQEERVRFDEKQQAVLDREIAKRVKAQREAERRAESLQQELEEVRSKLPQDQRPEIPEMPNPWDDNYDDKMAKREEAIRAQIKWDTENEYRQQQEQHILQQQQQERIRSIQTAQQSYNQRAQTLGLDQSELQQAANTVAQFGVPFELVEYVLEDDLGPAITLHLANNVSDLEKIRSMHPVKAAAYIAGTIKPGLKPRERKPAAPAPTDQLKGAGAAPQRGPKGATFE